MNAGSPFSELKFHFKTLFADLTKDNQLPSSQPTTTTINSPVSAAILNFNSQPDSNICNNTHQKLNYRHYNFSALGPNFCTLINIIFLYVGGNDLSADLKIVCSSSTDKIPMDSRLAIAVTKLLKKYMKRPMRKTPNGHFVWSAPFKHYPSLLKTFANLKFNINGIPPTTLSHADNINTKTNDAFLMETNLSDRLKRRLLPFQRQGVIFALRRAGRVFIADEMGTGKSIQALCIASCYKAEWPLLIITPASLRTVWANEIEKWLFPDVLPCDIQLLTSSNQIYDLSKRIVITSFMMLSLLRAEIESRRFKVIIVDECHKIRGSSRRLPTTTKACLKVLSSAKRAILLSGTPCISKPFNLYHQVNCVCPGILGTPSAFAKNYCGLKMVCRRGRVMADTSGGNRLDELRALLLRNLMIRRLKSDVQKELPKLTRQVLIMDIVSDSKAVKKALIDFFAELNGGDVAENQNQQPTENVKNSFSPEQTVGILKIKGVGEFIKSILEGTEEINGKIVVFAHHKNVIKGLVQFAEKLSLDYIVIQGHVLPEERFDAVRKFHRDPHCRVAFVSITAGNVGFDLSCATRMVFAEMPATQADLRQAESRLHRRNQTGGVNAYYAIAANTCDQSRWRELSRQLSKTTDLLNARKEVLRPERIIFSAPTEPGTDGLETDKAALTVATNMATNPAKVAENEAKAAESENPRRGSVERKVAKKEIKSENCADFERERWGKAGKSGKGRVLGKMRSGSVPSEKRSNPYRKGGLWRGSTVFEAYWVGKRARQRFFGGPVHVMFSGYSDRLFLFNGPDVGFYRGKSVEISDVLNVKTDAVSLINERADEAVPFMISPLSNIKAFSEVRRLCEEWVKTSRVSRNKVVNKVIPTDYCFVQSKRKKKPVSVRSHFINEIFNNPNINLTTKNGQRVTEIFEMGPKKDPKTGKRIIIETFQYIAKSNGNNMKTGKITQKLLENRTPLCLCCDLPYELPEKRLAEPRQMTSFFCRTECFRDFKVKTVPAQARRQIFDAEKGVCRVCEEDVRGLYLRLVNLSPSQRLDVLSSKQSFRPLSQERLRKICGAERFTEGLLWQADHIVPVQFGGGACSLENLQTLCAGCHYLKTREQSRLASVVNLGKKRKIKALGAV